MKMLTRMKNKRYKEGIGGDRKSLLRQILIKR